MTDRKPREFKFTIREHPEGQGFAIVWDATCLTLGEFHTIEYSALQPLLDALEKIADPRKRDHREPDAYTELGCVMHIAYAAITKFRGEK